MEADPLIVPQFVTTTLGILVFLVGVRITRSVAFLRDFNIPEPVSGGLVAAIIAWIIFLVTDRPIEFEMGARDYFLVVFFSAIGLNARLSDLVAGGRPLGILLVLTVAFIFVQNLIGVGSALSFGMPPELGVLMGSAALIGGHGTSIAWAPIIGEQTGFAGALEMGIAFATIGLVIAALIGGPIAKFLIEKFNLHPAHPEVTPTVGLSFEDQKTAQITHIDMMRILFVLHVVIIIGFFIKTLTDQTSLNLPLFVPCMLTGIVVGNLLPMIPQVKPVTRTPALALMSEFSLGIFLAMSLMALQLWTLAGVGLLMLVTMGLQTIVTVIYVVALVFPFMGRSYRAAVLSSGFAGFGLGATPTAIANMNAITKRYGPSPVAFVILPLVSAFFVDLANALAIQTFLSF